MSSDKSQNPSGAGKPKRKRNSLLGSLFGSKKEDKQLQKAIAEAEQMLQEDPGNARNIHKLGDLHAKAGNKLEALECYSAVADMYAKINAYQKSLSVFKQILKLDPERIDIRYHLAEVYYELDRRKECLFEFQNIISFHEKSGEMGRAQETIKRMIEIEPLNSKLRLKLAESYMSSNQQDEAIDAFRETLNVLESEGRWDDFITVGERYTTIVSFEPDIYKKLAQIYFNKSETSRAIGRLQTALRLDRDDLDALELLSSCYEELGETQKALRQLERLITLYRAKSQQDKLDQVYARIAKLDPNNSAVQKSLEQTAIEQENLLIAQEIIAPMSDEEIDDQLAKAKIYVKYGMMDKVREIIQDLRIQIPDDPRLRRIRAEFYELQGQFETAGKEYLLLARQCTEKKEALELLENILSMENCSAELQEDAYQLSLELRGIQK